LAALDTAHALAMVGAGLAFGGAAVGAAIGDGVLMGRTIEGIARQPEARGLLFGQTIVFYGLVEALPVIALVFGLLMFFRS
jgi:F-type H+-transporting ATPase subunit c